MSLYSSFEFTDEFARDEVNPTLAICAVYELLEKNITPEQFKTFIDLLLENKYILTDSMLSGVSEYKHETIEWFFEEVIELFPEQRVFSEEFQMFSEHFDNY